MSPVWPRFLGLWCLCTLTLTEPNVIHYEWYLLSTFLPGCTVHDHPCHHLTHFTTSSVCIVGTLCGVIHISFLAPSVVHALYNVIIVQSSILIYPICMEFVILETFSANVYGWLFLFTCSCRLCVIDVFVFKTFLYWVHICRDWGLLFGCI